eukprot:scaffold16283_cov517-Ochromonas_danica.AAC.1
MLEVVRASDPEGLEGGQGGQDGPSDPRRVQPLRRCGNANLRLSRRLAVVAHFMQEALSISREECGPPCQHYLTIESTAKVEVCAKDGS